MSTEDKIAWIEKILDKNTNTIESLSKEITKIDTYFKIAFGVATILGISGAFVFSSISNVSGNLERYEAKAGKLQKQIDTLRDTDIKSLETGLEMTRRNAVDTIKSTGEKQKTALLSLLNSITPSELANGMLKGNIKNLLVKNCDQANNCPCPSGWKKAEINGGNGDLNKGSGGNFIYICVQYY